MRHMKLCDISRRAGRVDDRGGGWLRDDFVVSCLCLSFLGVLLALASMQAAARGGGVGIVSWVGNTSDWNRILGVTELRLACSSEPSTCLAGARIHAKKNKVDRVVIVLPGKTGRILEYLRYYVHASQSEALLTGVSVDDFLSAVYYWRGHSEEFSSVANTIEQIVAIIHSEKVVLPFGITMYEDQLNSELLLEPSFPAALRAKVDRVSLYLHHRENGKGYSKYVRRVRGLFPNAEIYAGVYAYDRIDYISCSQYRHIKCTNDQEVQLFELAFKEQLVLLARGEISGLEFYPGWFGMERDWYGWDNNRLCLRVRRDECIDNTMRMRLRIVPLLRDSFRSSSAGSKQIQSHRVISGAEHVR